MATEQVSAERPLEVRPVLLVVRAVSTLSYCAAFPLFVLGSLAATSVIHLGFLPRYDAVLFLCLSFQMGMLAFRMETPKEFATIFLFHAMGTALEMFKVNHGGWYYPEPSWLKVMGVPLYSGFMYASVGSFILACWKRFDLRVEGFPRYAAVVPLVIATYANFFTNYWLWDMKPMLLIVAIALFARTRIGGRIGTSVARVRLPMVFLVLGPVVWCAENVGTWLGSWEYPRQADGWVAVPPDKLLSWTVLVMVSFLVVTLVRRESIR
jgi:uncharacterized membrane protein YoaT (DUF817 family)